MVPLANSDSTAALPGSARVGGIDFLRGFGALAVFAFHLCYQYPSTSRTPWGELLPGLTRFGYLGVPVFFMISGYVISKSAEFRTRPMFLASRATRLLPGFWLALILTLIALALSRQLPSPVTILSNTAIVAQWFGQPYVDGVYWSLTAEIAFYGAVGLIAIGARFRPRMRLIMLTWMALCALNWFIHVPAAVILNFPWAPYFAIGVFMYFRSTNASRLDDILLMVSVIIAAAQTIIYQSQFVGWNWPYLVTAAAIMVVGALTLFGLLVVAFSGAWQRIAIFFGAMSYPLYLIHNEFGRALIGQMYGIQPRLGPIGVLIVLFTCYLIAQAEVRPARWIRQTITGLAARLNRAVTS
jgi:peptidoglycan/LPS O-acetylase OafA/YrhL